MSADPQQIVGEKHRNPNSLMNLRPPWKAGEASPNPGGVKKGQVFVSECYKRLLCLNPQELQEYQPKSAAEAMALRQIVTGIHGSEALPSVKEITDRTEGKAPQSITVRDESDFVDSVRYAVETCAKALQIGFSEALERFLAQCEGTRTEAALRQLAESEITDGDSEQGYTAPVVGVTERNASVATKWACCGHAAGEHDYRDGAVVCPTD